MIDPRPKLRRKPKKKKKKPLRLTEKEQRTVALDMMSGLTIKQACYKYNISGVYAHKIFHKFISVELRWRHR